MWKWLHPYANPEVSYHFVGKLLPWISKITIALLAIGIVWALVFAPADYQQGDSFRIFYINNDILPIYLLQWQSNGNLTRALYYVRFLKKYI